MPELPEVETVRQGLIPAMEGRVISSVEVRRPDLRWPFPENMATRLIGAQVAQIRRRSKYILVDLDTGESLLIHLGMSGRMTISGDAPGSFHRTHPIQEKHDHVVIDMDSGARITFNDPRRFGAMDMAPIDEIDRHPLLAKLGPEPLGNAFSAGTLITAFKNKRSPIKSALLDQRNVAGLGNIYVCEALWRSGINPTRHAGKISRARLEKLTVAIRDVLSEAIAAGGSSLKDFRQADGELGYFQHNFATYDQEDCDCQTPNCTGKISRIVQSGRSTFYCPTCQR